MTDYPRTSQNQPQKMNVQKIKDIDSLNKRLFTVLHAGFELGLEISRNLFKIQFVSELVSTAGLRGVTASVEYVQNGQ